MGLLILYNLGYFGNEVVGNTVRWLFIGTGIFGSLTEFGKIKELSKIAGLNDIWAGCICFAICFVFYHFEGNIAYRITSFVLLLIGVYGFIYGLLSIVYSLIKNRKTKVRSKANDISEILAFLTKIASLILVVLQIVKSI